MKSEAITEQFLQEERKLAELVAMTNSDPKIWEIQKEVVVIQKIRNEIEGMTDEEKSRLFRETDYSLISTQHT